MKKKDKVRVWRSNYLTSCTDYFTKELTAEEYSILVFIFRKFKFQAEINNSYVTLRRVRVQNYELTLQKDIVGRIKLMFKIINV